MAKNQKYRFYRIKEEQVKVIEDALRIALATVTEEYHAKPSLELAMRMDAVTETLDIFK